MTRYELLDRIGVGGMAEIFRGKAVAAGGFEKPVAIKRILPHLSQDKRFVELLIAEAKVLSLLKHRNIVQIYDVGLGDDGQYFLVMEYVDGKDLGALQRGLEGRRNRMPFDLALHVGGEICEALEHAHSARAPDGRSMSLVHRDVSPSNVLISRAGEVKLTDFGIAKRAEQEATGHGAVRGKFAYISPEQARNEHLEPRSDVFSVGILLWELITGRRLFSGLGDMEALRGVREAPIPRARDVDGRLSAEVDNLVATALSRDPRTRPTAGQLGQQLRTLRYSLDATVGDPATELAKIIDDAELLERQSVQLPTPVVPRLPGVERNDGGEATVIRIHTDDDFALRDKLDGAGMARARQVIDRFEEEETRLAQLSRDEIAFLRDHAAARDSGELTSAIGPAIEPPAPDGAGVPERLSGEVTRANAPLVLEATTPPRPRVLAPAQLTPSGPLAPPPLAGRRPEDAPTYLAGPLYPVEAAEPHDDEATRLLDTNARRTPPPELVPRARRPSTQPPPLDRELPPRARRPSTQPPPSERIGSRRLAAQAPPMPSERTPAPITGHTPAPGTVQGRSLPAHPAPPPSSQSMSQPSLPPPRREPPPPTPPRMPSPAVVPAPMAQLKSQPGMQPRPATAPPPRLAPLAQPMPPPPQPMPPPQAMPMAPMPQANYPNWAQRPPPPPIVNALSDIYNHAQRPSAVALPRPRRILRPWMLVVGALVMALVAFAITRAFIHR